MAGPSAVGRLKAGATRRYARAKARHEWLNHAIVAYQRYIANNGNQYAAAITYFSFLALFPLILLAVSIAGFVLTSAQITDLTDAVSSGLPGDFGDKINESITRVLDNPAGIGLIGLAGILLTGLGWIGNLRAAYNAVWGVPLPKRNVVTAKVTDLVVLVGLGIGGLTSIAITAVGTALTSRILSATGLDGVPGAQLLTTVLGLAVAVAADVLIFGWLLVQLPATDVRFRFIWRGALLSAVGFEVLKIGATYLLAGITRSPGAAVFGSSLVILVFIDFVARWQLFAAAWTATGMTPVKAPAVALDRGEPPTPGAIAAPLPRPAVLSPAGVAASLVGAGAAVGGAAVAWAGRRWRRRDAS